MKKSLSLKIVLVITVLLMSLLPAILVSADSIDYGDTYTWENKPEGTWGFTYNKIGVLMFNMSNGYDAFCADKIVTAHHEINYVKLSLEDGVSNSIITNAPKLRAILMYSEDKESMVEITAIQYAIWHVLDNSQSIPGSRFGGMTDDQYIEFVGIYNKLLETPPLAPADAVITNTLTIEKPAADCLILGDEAANYVFDFTATSSNGSPITFEVYNKSDLKNPLGSSLYSITGSGNNYKLTLKGISVPSTFVVKATTQHTKTYNTCVFVTFDKNDDTYSLDKTKSQTVLGIKLTEETQNESFEVCFEDPTPTTTTTATPTTTTTATPTTTTTAAPTTTTTAPSDASVTSTTTTLIEMTTSKTPLASVTTTTATPTTTTTAPVSTLTNPDIPKTGENDSGNGLLIGLVLLALAGTLSVVVFRRKSAKQ